MKVLFLDLDGPVITNRACLILPYDVTCEVTKHNGTVLAYDWVITNFLAKMCVEYGIKIVMISSWRKHKDLCDAFLKRVNLFEHLHEDWCTKDLRTDPDTPSFRGSEVSEWLRRHPEIGVSNDNYRIIDDHNDFMNDLMPSYLQVNGYNGIDYETMNALIEWNTGKHGYTAPL